MRGHVVFGTFLAITLISNLFSFSVFAQDQFLIMENPYEIDNSKFVPGQLVVGLKTPDPNFHSFASQYGGQKLASIAQINAHLFKISSESEEKFIQAMLKNPNVDYVAPNGIVKAFDIPNDPIYPYQWGTQRIGMESVWSTPFNQGSGITIAVIDEGLYYDHADLNLFNIRTDIDKDFVIRDSNGQPTNDSYPSPFPCFFTNQYENHGTWVTGVIASQINNLNGIAGVGQFDILPLRALNECGGGTLFNVADAIVYAADQDVDVINLSLGHETFNHPYLLSAIEYATAFPDEIVVVAASGNDALKGNPINYPAAYSKVVAVGATARDDTITDYSSYGPHLDISAPGGTDESGCSQIDTTWIVTIGGPTNNNNNQYYCVGGTSFAAPLVSAVAGLVKSANPCATDDEIKSHLEQTAEYLGASPTGWDEKYGHGIVRSDIALSIPVTIKFPCLPVITLEGDNPQIVQVNTPYIELGATAVDPEDGELSSSIIIDSSAVNTTTSGNYTVTYDVTDLDGNAADQVIRTVIVQDSFAPVITLIGDDPQIIEAAPPPSVYVELNATAYDEEDGDLSSSINIDSSAVDTSTPGIYAVTYDVTDLDGNSAAQVVRTVILQDTIVPVITLLGNNPQIIEVNSVYVELGATASDNLEGNLTDSIIIDSSSVDMSTPGDYYVTYDVSDSSGNSANQSVRTVTVQDTSGGLNTIHVGDLNWQASDKKNWTSKVFISIHNQDEQPVSNVLVQATFSENQVLTSVNCITDTSGTCQVTKSTKLDELSFEVVGISATNYESSDTHHDPEGDFIGDPVVTIFKGINSIGDPNGGGSGGTEPSCPPNSNKPSCR